MEVIFKILKIYSKDFELVIYQKKDEENFRKLISTFGHTPIIENMFFLLKVGWTDIQKTSKTVLIIINKSLLENCARKIFNSKNIDV